MVLQLYQAHHLRKQQIKIFIGGNKPEHPVGAQIDEKCKQGHDFLPRREGVLGFRLIIASQYVLQIYINTLDIHK